MSTCHCEECHLRKLSIFCHLGEDSFLPLREATRRASFGKNATVFVEGDPARRLYVVRSGWLKTGKRLVDGREQIIKVCHEGDALGLEALFRDSYTTTAEALGDVELCTLEKGKLISVLGTSPGLALGIISALGKELEAAQEKVAQLGLHSAKERAASYLLSLPREGNVVKVPLPRFEIARLLGLTTETLARMLSALEDDGLVRILGREVTLLDLRALGALVR